MTSARRRGPAATGRCHGTSPPPPPSRPLLVRLTLTYILVLSSRRCEGMSCLTTLRLASPRPTSLLMQLARLRLCMPLQPRGQEAWPRTHQLDRNNAWCREGSLARPNLAPSFAVPRGRLAPPALSPIRRAPKGGRLPLRLPATSIKRRRRSPARRLTHRHPLPRFHPTAGLPSIACLQFWSFADAPVLLVGVDHGRSTRQGHAAQDAPVVCCKSCRRGRSSYLGRQRRLPFSRDRRTAASPATPEFPRPRILWYHPGPPNHARSTLHEHVEHPRELRSREPACPKLALQSALGRLSVPLLGPRLAISEGHNTSFCGVRPTGCLLDRAWELSLPLCLALYPHQDLPQKVSPPSDKPSPDDASITGDHAVVLGPDSRYRTPPRPRVPC